MRVRFGEQMRSEKNRQARKNRMYPDGLNLAEEVFAANIPHGIYISTDSYVRKYQLQNIIGAGLFMRASLRRQSRAAVRGSDGTDESFFRVRACHIPSPPL
jgi:hypothetical protein